MPCFNVPKREKKSTRTVWYIETRNQLTGAVSAGHASIQKAAEWLNIPYKAVCNIMCKYHKTRTVSCCARPSCGQKQSLLVNLDVCWHSLDDCFKPFRQLGKETTPPILATLIWDILKQYRLHYQQACKVIRKSQETRDRRLEWALMLRSRALANTNHRAMKLWRRLME
jgi:hypothetical protein